jgi:hypothetical protein
MPLAGFEHSTATSERPQTYALDRAATGIGKIQFLPRSKHNGLPSITKANVLMLFIEIIAVYCRNYRKGMNTLGR